MKCEQLVIDTNEIKSFECDCQVGYHLNMTNFQQCEGITFSCFFNHYNNITSLPDKHPWALYHDSPIFSVLGAYPGYWALTLCKN